MFAFRKRLLITLIGALLLFTACNFPMTGTPGPSGQEVVLTYAAQTVEAQLTLAVAQPTITPGGPESTPTPQSGDTPAPATQTPGEGNTPAPTEDAQDGPTPTAGICDRGAWVRDITYPDDSRVEPGEQFTKIWRIRNTGTCTWDPTYAVVFDRGEAMSSTPSFPLTATVAPGQEVDIAVTLTAPTVPGTYQGHWKLRNSAGVTFGLGQNADRDFWVKVNVGITAGITYDFIAQSTRANWVSSGGGSDTNLTFGGDENDPNGVARLRDGVVLEDGTRSGMTLITHPKHTDDGRISGTFPEYTVLDGDHFRANLGFLENCGTGQVVFQLGYREGGSVQTIREWRKACDGQSNNVSVDLSSLRGKRVQFILAVLADGSPVYDLVNWGSARIER